MESFYAQLNILLVVNNNSANSLSSATLTHLSREPPLSSEEKEQMCRSAIDTETLPRVRLP